MLYTEKNVDILTEIKICKLKQKINSRMKLKNKLIRIPKTRDIQKKSVRRTI